MNISNVMHQPISSTSTAPLVNHFAAPSAIQTDLRASVFKPVGQVVPTQGQTVNLNPGTVYSPLHIAVQAYGFNSDIAESLVTYGANGKINSANGFLNSRQEPAHVTLANEQSISQSGGAIQAGDVDFFGRKKVLSDAPNDAPAAEAIKQKEQDIEQKMQDEVRRLAARDREVRAHEQAHAAIGGAHAGAPKYQFEQGPDGVNYAVGGEVPIDVGPAATPELTLEKAQTVRRAAMAPSEPSPQDRQVAQEAMQLEATARHQIAAERASEATAKRDEMLTHRDSKNDSAAVIASTQNVNENATINEPNRPENNPAWRIVSAYQASSTAPANQNFSVDAFA